MNEIQTAPAAVAGGAQPATAAGPRLYSMGGIMWATFIGNLFATGLLMAHNYRALGQPRKARDAMLLAVAGMVVLLMLVFVLPENVPALVFSLPQLLAAYQVAKPHQLHDVDPHLSRAGALHSNWRAAGIGLLVSLGTVAAVLPLALLIG
ncbi:hypothetical protein OOT46_10840 [Aquabacterium sp. A7-Y]|uniref:hypothetical protein n=1 Tax=Aquabacterium sp. A7-Y TaxID=1349605 RepID=UPI00223E41CE|nr:hypothetical protein [Aquabacterium sp. A7-Y]MCW7538336.1 hypothetical protein [Aquabacterium sp. A7-Y]